jgi:hypothetical protein
MIAYHDMNGMLLFAHPVGNGWAYEPVDPTSVVTGSTAIARTPGGAGIAYVDVASGVLKYAEQNAGGMWIVQQVAVASNAEAYPSLLVDGPLRAISYYDAIQGDLRLAQSVNAAPWGSELVDGIGNVGGYSSLIGGSDRDSASRTTTSPTPICGGRARWPAVAGPRRRSMAPPIASAASPRPSHSRATPTITSASPTTTRRTAISSMRSSSAAAGTS